MAALLPLKSAEYYRAEAARLRREAEAAPNKVIRQQLVGLAHSCNSLALSVEALARAQGRVGRWRAQAPQT
jgi:hypothetical protein